jgi:hypothetical protein
LANNKGEGIDVIDEEKEAMLSECYDFDKELIYEKYKAVVESQGRIFRPLGAGSFKYLESRNGDFQEDEGRRT